MISLNTQPGSKIRCIDDGNAQGWLKKGEIYILARWYVGAPYINPDEDMNPVETNRWAVVEVEASKHYRALADVTCHIGIFENVE